MEIKNYSAGDEEKIFELFELAFSKKMSFEYWNWRFIKNPFSKPMIKLMWDNDLLVGHYAVSPNNLNYFDETILTALSMTTMTHPDYSGKGIFGTLAESLYRENSAIENLKAVWGFPNNNSHYGFIKNLNWKNLELFPSFSLSTQFFKPTKNTLFKSFKNFNSNHINAIDKTNKNYTIYLKRNLEYLNWRYSQNPIHNYDYFEYENNECSFFVVTKKFNSFSDSTKQEIDVLELFIPNDFEIIHTCISNILEYYNDNNISKINLWLPLNDPKHILFEKAGFVQNLPITYSGIVVLDDKYSKLSNPNNWYISMGDSDIY